MKSRLLFIIAAVLVLAGLAGSPAMANTTPPTNDINWGIRDITPTATTGTQDLNWGHRDGTATPVTNNINWGIKEVTPTPTP